MSGAFTRQWQMYLLPVLWSYDLWLPCSCHTSHRKKDGPHLLLVVAPIALQTKDFVVDGQLLDSWLGNVAVMLPVCNVESMGIILYAEMFLDHCRFKYMPKLPHQVLMSISTSTRTHLIDGRKMEASFSMHAAIGVVCAAVQPQPLSCAALRVVFLGLLAPVWHGRASIFVARVSHLARESRVT